MVPTAPRPAAVREGLTIPIDVCGAGVSFPIVVRVSLIWVVVVGAVVTAVSHVISVIVILGWVVMEGAVVPVVWDFIIVIIVITGVADPVLVVVLLPGVGQVGAVILEREDAHESSVRMPLAQPEPGAWPPDAPHGLELLCSPMASYGFSREDTKLSIFLGDMSFV